MIKAAIVLDDWKLLFFKEVLDREGFTYETKPGLTKGTLTLRVEIESARSFSSFVSEANTNAAKSKLN